MDLRPPFSDRRALWLVARRGLWNDAGTDARHRRLEWLQCPKTCETMRRSKRDPYGCHGDTSKPIQQDWPGRFDTWPGWDKKTKTGGLHTCPNKLLRAASPLVLTVLHLVRDYRAGVIRPAWRDYYAAHVVEAVDYAITESDAASGEQAAMR